MVVSLETIRYLGPELLLMILASGMYLAGAFKRGRLLWTGVALAGYVVAVLLMQISEAPTGGFWDVDPTAVTTSGPVVVDYLGYWLRCTALVVGVIFTLVAARASSERLASEYLATLMLLVLGLMLVARANDLVLLFVSLEMISIPTYVLLYMGPPGRVTSEATVKYFFLSILSSALFLYGVSVLYGITGTTTLVSDGSIPSIQAAEPGSVTAAMGVGQTLAPLALVMLLAGLGFKLAAVPFHFYAPDVYQGSTNANAGLLAVAPKIAGLAAMIRLLVVAMPWLDPFAWQLTIVLAVLTMTIGNVCALWQTNLRRLMAYSSVAHAGYLLMGVAAAFALGQGSGATGGVSAALFYLLVYSFASLGTFAALTHLGSEGRQISKVEELAGLARSQPVMAGCLALFMFSLAGIPPLAGFWGKFSLFMGAISSASSASAADLPTWFILLAVIGALNAAIAAGYYLRIVATLYFQPTAEPLPVEGNWGTRAATLGCGVLVVLLGLFPGYVASASRAAEESVSANRLRLVGNVSGSGRTSRTQLAEANARAEEMGLLVSSVSEGK